MLMYSTKLAQYCKAIILQLKISKNLKKTHTKVLASQYLGMWLSLGKRVLADTIKLKISR